MYIEFELNVKQDLWDQSRAQLQHELRKWCYQHGLDYWSINTHSRDRRERVELPSTKAYELFCISWRPEQEYLRKYRLIRS